MPRQRSLFLSREGQPLFSRTSVGCVSVKEGGGLVLDPQSHSALRVIHCLGPPLCSVACRERRGQLKGREGAELGSCWVPGVCTYPQHILTYSPFSPKRPCSLMFIMCPSVLSHTHTYRGHFTSDLHYRSDFCIRS